uniref:RIN4 pathogenic type III effector avirulence factor Avr cleavage site domain-containing protein n=1 Tax=Setaria italica TaxID=4555 RepID=K4AF34_SETIT
MAGGPGESPVTGLWAQIGRQSSRHHSKSPAGRPPARLRGHACRLCGARASRRRQVQHCCCVTAEFAPQLHHQGRQGPRKTPRTGGRESERSSMENLKERGQDAAGGNGWMTVPAFGDWDMKNGALPDYSMDFSKIREMRKQNKKELSRASLGGDDDLAQTQQQQQRNQAQAKAQPKLGRPADDHRRPLHDRDHSPTGGKKFLSYFQCCIKA